MALTPKQIQGVIKTHRTKSRIERKDWDRWRAWYAAEYWGQQEDRPSGSTAIMEEEDINFQTNYPYAYIDTMIANICLARGVFTTWLNPVTASRNVM